MEDEEKMQEALFMQLVVGLQSSGWMMLGKTPNPITGKIEKDLDAAKATIETLRMLKTKTKGNLSKTENDYLSNSIQQLQLNYVEESKIERTKSKENLEENTKKNNDVDSQADMGADVEADEEPKNE